MANAVQNSTSGPNGPTFSRSGCPGLLLALEDHGEVRDLEAAIPAARLPHSIAVTELEIAQLAQQRANFRLAPVIVRLLLWCDFWRVRRGRSRRLIGSRRVCRSRLSLGRPRHRRRCPHRSVKVRALRGVPLSRHAHPVRGWLVGPDQIGGLGLHGVAPLNVGRRARPDHRTGKEFDPGIALHAQLVVIEQLQLDIISLAGVRVVYPATVPQAAPLRFHITNDLLTASLAAVGFIARPNDVAAQVGAAILDLDAPRPLSSIHTPYGSEAPHAVPPTIKPAPSRADMKIAVTRITPSLSHQLQVGALAAKRQAVVRRLDARTQLPDERQGNARF